MSPRALLAALLVAAGAVAAQDVEVEAAGWGPTVEAATRAANRAAIEKGVGQVLTSQTEVENFQVKRDLVLTRTVGAVKSSRTVSREQGPDGAWEVHVVALVSKAEIREDLAALGILRAALDFPRVAVLVSETNLGQAVPDGVAEAGLIQAFRERGFEVVDPSNELRTRRASQISLALGGDAKAAAALGEELGAEVMVVGTASATESDMSGNPAFAGSGMKSTSADLVLKAVDVGSREILASGRGDKAAVHINPRTAGSKALESATRSLVEQQGGFFDQLTASWQAHANDGMVLRVKIRNVPNYEAGQVLKADLEARDEASTVVVRKLSEGVLFLDVTWRGTAQDFCSAMDGRKVNRDRNRIAVASQEGKNIVLEVK